MIHLGDYKPGEVVYLPIESGWTFTGAVVVIDGEVQATAADHPTIDLADYPDGAQCWAEVQLTAAVEDDLPLEATELYVWTVGRQLHPGDVVPATVAGTVNANILSAAGREWDNGAISRATLQSKLIDQGLIDDGAISAKKIGAAAIQASTFAGGALDASIVSPSFVAAVQEALTGRAAPLSTDPHGRVRLAIGDRPGEILLREGAVARVNHNDDAVQPAPTPAANAAAFLDAALADHRAEGSVAVHLQQLARAAQVADLHNIAVTDIVQGGPIRTREGAVADVVHVAHAGQVVGSVGSVKGDIGGTVHGGVSTVTGDVQGSVGALGDTARLQVRDQVEGALNDTLHDEPGQGEVPVKTSLADKIGWLFKAFRNRIVEDDDTWNLLNSDGATVDQTADKMVRDGQKIRDTVTSGRQDAVR